MNILSKEELLSLFNSSIDNALDLFTSSTIIFKEKTISHISLGLAELALEELGKSYTCLSYYCLGGVKRKKSHSIWNHFWKDWKNHTVKAHRGFFYEFFCLWRIEINNANNYIPTKQKTIPSEKEISFYVDFDLKTRKIITPFKDIDFEETTNRVSTIIGLLNSAFRVKELINKNMNDEYITAISNYALVTITENVFQQDVENILKELENGVKMHDKALEDIYNLFTKKLEE